MLSDRHFLAASWRSWFARDGVPVGPAWLQWVWTAVFAALLAVAFTMLGVISYSSADAGWPGWRGVLRTYGVNLVITLCVAATIRLLFMLLLPWIGPPRIRQFNALQRALFFTGVPLLGVLIGGPPGLWLSGYGGSLWLEIHNPGSMLASLALAVLISSIIYLVFNAKSRQVQAERRATEAQLRLLQGQIEPHFLFNTLANVSALIEPEPALARQMLESFTDYLRASLTALRHEQATLGSELDLVGAYLELMKTRMQDRLHFSIDSDIALRGLRLPALLLQPLVENAIHHGLEAKMDGGSIRIRARSEGRRLVIDVVDDGLGLAAPQQRRRGAGMALLNLRERLAAQFGAGASLTLHDNQPGTRATLQLPLDTLQP